jgi:hypothetical protein
LAAFILPDRNRNEMGRVIPLDHVHEDRALRSSAGFIHDLADIGGRARVVADGPSLGAGRQT